MRQGTTTVSRRLVLWLLPYAGGPLRSGGAQRCPGMRIVPATPGRCERVNRGGQEKRGNLQMAESRSHKSTAIRLAELHNSAYNPGPGADIKTEDITIEVETADTVADAGRQLGGHRGPVFVGCTTQEAVRLALERYKDSTIGVMDKQGKVIKKSTRKP